MKNDANELRQVAATQAPRHDIYAGIHKAIRALMADTLLAVGRMDSTDELEVAQVTQRVLELLDFCTSHLGHENEYLHTAIEARAAGASERIAHEHVEHEAHIAALGRSVAALRATPADSRAGAALDLYRQLSLFVAENYQHMYVEETAHNAVLWARYTDAELEGIHHRLVASIPPAEMMFGMRWLVPFMNPQERAGLLSDVQRNAPPPAFQAILDTVRPHLAEAEWAKLAASLQLAQPA
ncbi:hemerythrin domain-containing protein [Caenimonas aquaedulcis]|uniref:Hemerythrin domain-containing protein n=1 Tax=Caenimonas aquaedulcis TaxID=2793270 RepID=A0A931MIN1_9BURK|nr:hemerythrin domain-containing protein [Caenimonas aquaedulcis]MBG9389435.1 hemerythrin domain-containing protein [Caenimonas aquaedulcis]